MVPRECIARAHPSSYFKFARSSHAYRCCRLRPSPPERGFLSADGKWRLSVEPDQIDPLYRRMLLAAEERSAAARRVLAATPQGASASRPKIDLTNPRRMTFLPLRFGIVVQRADAYLRHSRTHSAGGAVPHIVFQSVPTIWTTPSLSTRGPIPYPIHRRYKPNCPHNWGLVQALSQPCQRTRSRLSDRRNVAHCRPCTCRADPQRENFYLTGELGHSSACSHHGQRAVGRRAHACKQRHERN